MPSPPWSQTPRAARVTQQSLERAASRAASMALWARTCSRSSVWTSTGSARWRHGRGMPSRPPRGREGQQEVHSKLQRDSRARNPPLQEARGLPEVLGGVAAVRGFMAAVDLSLVSESLTPRAHPSTSLIAPFPPLPSPLSPSLLLSPPFPSVFPFLPLIPPFSSFLPLSFPSLAISPLSRPFFPLSLPSPPFLPILANFICRDLLVFLSREVPGVSGRIFCEFVVVEFVVFEGRLKRNCIFCRELVVGDRSRGIPGRSREVHQ